MNTTSDLRRARQHRDAGCSRHRRTPKVSWGSHLASEFVHVCTRTVSAGSVLLAHVPFADGTGFKVRPVVVLRLDGRTLVVRPCTSQVGRHPHLPQVQDLDSAGLPRASAIRSEVLHLETEDVLKALGRLSDDDLLVLNDTIASSTLDSGTAVAA